MKTTNIIEDYDPSIKIIVVGNGMVGKTTLAIRFAKNVFTTEYKKTLGVDFLQKSRYISAIDKKVSFFLWDTAGQDYYDAITRRYYKGADAALIVFSMTDLASYQNVKKWKEKVDAECDNIPIILVMSKVDLVGQGVVTEQQAQELAKELNLKLYKVSSKDNLMVNEVFDTLAIEHFRNGGTSSEPLNVKSLTKKNIDNQYEIKEVETIKEVKDDRNTFTLSSKKTQVSSDPPKKKSCCSIF